jgi:pimeloyl-ACP methyl ester carboxylesterase
MIGGHKARPPEQETEMTVAETQMTTSADGTPIAFDRLGDGAPLILVGGAWNNRHSPAALAELLADGFAVYSYDRRGRGDSGDTPPYAVERELEDLAAVIEAAGGLAFAFGHSSGASLALEATAAGVPISKLAMYEPPYIVDDSRPPLAADYIEHLDALVAAGKRREVIRYFMTEAVGLPPEMVQPLLDSPMVESMEPLAHTVAYDGRVMLMGSMHSEPLPTRWTDTVTVPALVMDGGNSPAWGRNACRALVGVLPDVQYRTLAGQDHAAAPEAVAPLLAEFFG